MQDALIDFPDSSEMEKKILELERMKLEHCDSTFDRKIVLFVSPGRERTPVGLWVRYPILKTTSPILHLACVISATSTCVGRIVKSLKQILLTSHMLGLSIHTKKHWYALLHHKPERYKKPILLLWNHHPLLHSHGCPPHMIASGFEDESLGLMPTLPCGHFRHKESTSSVIPCSCLDVEIAYQWAQASREGLSFFEITANKIG